MEPVGSYLKIELIPEQNTGLITSPNPNQWAEVLSVSKDIDTVLKKGCGAYCPKNNVVCFGGGCFIDENFVLGTK